MPSEMDSYQFENLYSSALFPKLSFHLAFLHLLVLRDLQTLTLAHIYQNLHSAKFSLTLAKPWWCSEIKTRLQCGRS